eukprot:CAMPEP_0168323590 /NCGR_PEP_ID=MMETSP0213-20121227/3568_1 /TAXON_ID=151035 /ORGANISM="Euplotes harpa, Strain FSP1.4" /LENGTH=253 /DNA_ID=CAMNT_0008325683 /DNA_START=36 /DNA_END=797 /DNA_ORIENTATION=+
MRRPVYSKKLALGSFRAFSGGFYNHRSLENNNQETPFEFTDENYDEIKRILKKFPAELQTISDHLDMNGCPEAEQQLFDFECDEQGCQDLGGASDQCVRSDVLLYDVQPRARWQVSFTSVLNDSVHDQGLLRDHGHHHRETWHPQWGDDRGRPLHTTRSRVLGCVNNAPMMQVNNEWFYEDLTPENTALLLDKMREGTGFTPGPQIPERKNAEGPQGRTTLTNVDHKVHDRDFAQAKADWIKAKEAAAAQAKK